MAQKTINELKAAFADNKEPNGEDFGNIFDSYRHKSTKIEQSQILGLNAKFTEIDNTKATKEELANATINDKGIFTTVEALNVAYPAASNKKGFYAFVGTANPFRKWEVEADGGQWIDTGQDINIADIDLAEYAKSGGSDKSVQQLDDATKAAQDSIVEAINNGIYPLIQNPDKKLAFGWDVINNIPVIPNILKSILNSIGIDQLNSKVASMLTKADLFAYSDEEWIFAVKSADGRIILGRRYDGIFVPQDSRIAGLQNRVRELEEKTNEISVVTDSRQQILIQDKAWEAASIGFYKVLKISDNLWYMWYQAWANFDYGDYGCKTCFAWSEDGENWLKEIPDGTSRADNIINGRDSSLREGWVELDVFADQNDSEYPYRIIYNKMQGATQKGYMAKSANGWDWTDHQLVFDSYHDTQYSAFVQADGNYMILLRRRDNALRTVGYAILSPAGELLTYPATLLISNWTGYLNLYTTAATRLASDKYILFPTMFNNDTTPVKIAVAYVENMRGKMTFQDITGYLMQGDTMGFATVCPSMTPTNIPNEYWLYYNRRIGNHSGTTDMTTIYYRIKIRIK
ncbi:hypothetical protein FACS1894169_01170 [Bacteroidia bacterium]|nr:hypothetical protein FACS1894169_01170 [Bacteroidia bacterium]